MAVVGVGLSGLLAAVAAAVLLAHLLRSSARAARRRRARGGLRVADVVSGRTTFALGAVAALGALALLPGRGPAAVAAALSGLLSPVAAAFLGLAAAVLVLRRLPGGWRPAWPRGPGGAARVAVPGRRRAALRGQLARYAVLAGLVLAVLTTSPPLRLGGLLYAGAAAVLVLVSDPFGSNVLRLGLLLAAPLVVATAGERRRVVVPVTARCCCGRCSRCWPTCAAPARPRSSR